MHGLISHDSKLKEGRSKKEEDRCFLSVLLFNYRNNGRFPFQLIILLVSRPHCTRTGRDNLIVGIVLKYTWYSGMCYVKRYPEGSITLTVNGNTLYYITPDNDLTLNILLITPWDNARLVCEVGLTSHWSCLNVSAWRGEGSLDDLMNHSCSISSTSSSLFSLIYCISPRLRSFLTSFVPFSCTSM